MTQCLESIVNLKEAKINKKHYDCNIRDAHSQFMDSGHQVITFTITNTINPKIMKRKTIYGWMYVYMYILVGWMNWTGKTHFS